MTNEERLLQKHGFDYAEGIHGTILLIWGATVRCKRGSADTVLTYLLPEGKPSAAVVAEWIDTYGQTAIDTEPRLIPAPHNSNEVLAQAGHGVTLIYSRSGRTRNVRAGR